jgi:RNA polymerase sigma-70 factor (ECF subfamily)
MGPERLGFLVERHAAALELYARQWCASPEDVVQEGFVKLSRLEPEPAQVVAWLYRVVRNAAISAGRSERRRQHHESAAARLDWFMEDSSNRLDSTTLADALMKLPLEEREIIIAHLWGGLTFEQIAELTGCSATTAHRHYSAGLNKLRLRLDTPCPPTTQPPK